MSHLSFSSATTLSYLIMWNVCWLHGNLWPMNEYSHWIMEKQFHKKKKKSPKSLEILTVYKELIWFHIYKYLNVFIWWQQSDKRCYVNFYYWFYYFSFHVNMWIHLWYLYSIFYKSLVAIFFYLFLIASLFSVFHIFFSWWL